MEIDGIELRLVKIPLKSPFQTSLGVMEEKEFVLVTLYGGGEAGYGESVAWSEPSYSEETTKTVWHMLETFLAPALFSEPIAHPEDLTSRLSPVRRNNMAKAALEGALWDLYCKQEGVSLASGVGGTRREIEVGVSVGIEPTLDRLVDRVETFLEQGYRKIKVKIKPGYDVEPLAAIRERFGDEVPLMADANSAYTLRDTGVLEELDRLGLLMIEQPLAYDDIVDHARLQERLTTPVCLDESIHSAEDARKAIELGSCRIVNVKVGRVGGLLEAKRLHDVCQQRGVPVWCGGMLESGVGRAHNIALASLDNFSIPGDTSASDRYWEEDIVRPPVRMSSPGIIEVPKGPGIGYEVSQDILDSYTLHKTCLVPEKR